MSAGWGGSPNLSGKKRKVERMLNKLRAVFIKHRETVMYLIFGGLTTLVNYIVYAVCCWLMPDAGTTAPNVIAWVLAVLFAYITNRNLVFGSETHGAGPVMRELAAFSGSRIFTLVLESAILWAAVDKMGMNNLVVKLLVNVLVIVLNYILSKLIVFRKKPK